MAIEQEKFEQLIKQFTLDTDQLKTVADSFRKEMVSGLAREEGASMAMLNSYIGMPKGDEIGDFLALDFGGTNLRVLNIHLTGDCKAEVIKKVARPLVTEEYNLINKDAKADDTFDFIADMVAEAVEGVEDKKFYLGHTFSFPSIQENIYNARLINWTKEFAIPGVEGEVVNDLLKAALERKGVKNVEPNSVINDTVAVLLAAAYQYPDTRIGVIYATGYNACYFESNHKDGAAPSIVNMECGNFDKLALSSCDEELNAKSERPANQHLEKMISGRYMGELLTIAAARLSGKEIADDFTAIDISDMLADDENSTKTLAIMKAKMGFECPECAQKLRELAKAISVRSARLAAAAMVGPIWHIAGDNPIEAQHIAVDGSVFQFMPGVQDTIKAALAELLGAEDAAKISPVLVTGGSGTGAAIAACVASK